jgi:glycosyltransferase involved in cell wall biosynthesis
MDDRPVRILHVVGGMNRGGVETWLMSVLRNLDQSRFQMDFLVHTVQECAYDAEIRSMGRRVIPCLHPSQPWRYGPQFRQILREYGPYDIVHSHVYWFSGYVMRLSSQAGVPGRIAHFHPHRDVKGEGLARQTYRSMMGRWIARYGTGVLANTQATLSAFNQNCDCSHLPQAVIHPIVDLASFAGDVDRNAVRDKYALPRDLPIVLYVARFYPHKNHHGFLEIARQVNSRGKMAHFAMAGSHGPLLPELQELVLAQGDVSILTQVNDVSELMKACDLFLFPSLNEGFGIVVLEAQAAGLPVVATNLPAVREALSPGLWTLTFEPDRLNTAVSHIQALLADEGWRRDLAQAGRQWAERFTIQDCVAELVNFYECATLSS